MRVLLVKSRLRAIHNPEIVPPMGLLYIAAALRKWRNDQVEIVDANLNSYCPQVLQKKLATFRPEVVGIGALTAEATFLHEVAAEVRRTVPQALVVAGGHYPSSEPERTLRDGNVHFVLSSEGEHGMVDLLNAIERGEPYESVPGLFFRQNGTIVSAPPRPLIQDLDALPFPAWDLLDLHAYAHQPTMGTKVKDLYMSLVTSRGCPFHCTYCHLLHGKRFRERSVENVLAECEALHALGVRELLIIDDIFNGNLDRAKQICRGLIERRFGFRLHFPNALRGDMCDEEFLVLLKEAGTELLCLAIESGSERIQRMVKRNLKLDKISWTIQKAREIGLYTMGFFILGFPTETREEMERTIAFAKKSALHSASFFILLPHPGTELGSEHYPHIFDDLKFHDGFLPPALMFNETAVSSQEIQRLLLKAHLSFYLQPHRLFAGPLRHAVRRTTEFFMQLPPRLLPLLKRSPLPQT